VPGGPARRAQQADVAHPPRLRGVHPAVSPSGARGRAAAMLDQLTDGRLELGTARTPTSGGASTRHREMWEESITSSPIGSSRSPGRRPEGAARRCRSRSRSPIRAVPPHADRQLRRGRDRGVLSPRPTRRRSSPNTRVTGQVTVRQGGASGATVHAFCGRTTARRASSRPARSRRSSAPTSRTSATASTPTKSSWNHGAACRTT
jgi:hypothetical protein